jgi:hypothetical protein
LLLIQTRDKITIDLRSATYEEIENFSEILFCIMQTAPLNPTHHIVIKKKSVPLDTNLPLRY